MTGLDQDMMQKNLTCPSLKDAQKNVVSFSLVLIVVNFLFLLLGALLFIYSNKMGIEVPVLDGKMRTDLLFPEIALNGDLGISVGIIFLLGLIAAAYSSADSALTGLTTSFSVDFLNIDNKPENTRKKTRKKVHIAMSVLLVIVVLIFNAVNDSTVIDKLLTVAGYTYGPLLGLFGFGILTKYKVKDQYVWIVATASAILSFVIGNIPPERLGGYAIGYELLVINGFITFLGMFLIKKKE